MKVVFMVVTVIAYLIAAFMLFGAVVTQNELRFVAFGVFASWGTAALVGEQVLRRLEKRGT